MHVPATPRSTAVSSCQSSTSACWRSPSAPSPAGIPTSPKHERPVAGQMVEAGQVAAEVGLSLEEDVEHQEVEALERQVLGGRVVGVGDELLGVLLAGDLDQARGSCRRSVRCRTSAARRPAPRCRARARARARGRSADAPPRGPPCAPPARPRAARGARCRADSASRDRRPRRGCASRARRRS